MLGGGTKCSMPFRPSIVIALPLAAQLVDELPGRGFQGRCTAFTVPSAAACEPATELSDGGDGRVRENIVGERGDEFVPLGAGQACGQHVDAVAWGRVRDVRGRWLALDLGLGFGFKVGRCSGAAGVGAASLKKSASRRSVSGLRATL